ncbi:MAG TPA: R3H domain-containing nucleic acid-binding protein [Armatimonadota bacterium]|jgi:stage III sporulation protein SpoIIIAA
MTPEQRVTDNMEQMLDILPPRLRQPLAEHPRLEELLEIILDLGRPIEARFPGHFELLSTDHCSHEDLAYVTERLGDFDRDNRAGIERTLHRISAIRNRRGEVVGLTCRVGRAVYGTIDIIRELVETGRNILFLGRPGVGKTTRLREVARVLADEFDKRVIVVDTNNEIAGDGDIPHPGIGRARRMQVPNSREQHDVMIEAVENHMPEVIVIDEIGTEAETAAARTIAERGVQLVGTAHGNDLENLMANPTLSDLVGGIHAVTLSDEEARRRRTQKTVLERKASPTFDTLIEIEGQDRLAIHHDVAHCVDRLLRGEASNVELRWREADEKVHKTSRAVHLAGSELAPTPVAAAPEPRLPLEMEEGPPHLSAGRIYPYGVSRRKVEKVLQELGSPAVVTRSAPEADLILALESRLRTEGAAPTGRPEAQVLTVRSNTHAQIKAALQNLSVAAEAAREAFALQEAREAIARTMATGDPEELLPQNSYVRRMQHELIAQHHLASRSIGREPRRRVRVMIQ